MIRDPTEMISRYFDDLLTEDEHRELQEWLRSSADHAREFARSALLHDRLRGEQLVHSLTAPPRDGQPRVPAPAAPRRWRSFVISLGAVAALVSLFVVLLDIGNTPAAATELRRLIAAQDSERDRTYRIVVEDVPSARRQHRRAVEDGRPPKPSLDGAILHVRRGQQFVLIRQLPSGLTFVTGSNGRTSWAVRPDGPVRVSNDLTRFNRDLPGHEHDFPLIQIEQNLEHLQAAYNIQLLPIENGVDAEAEEAPTRLLVAVKKRGQRGPQRVEITYAVRTGQIRQLRFIEMPYGPEHLTVRLTLEEETDPGSGFFDHQAHHTPDRIVEEE